MGKSIGLKDSTGRVICVGDILVSSDNYSVVVEEARDGVFYGKLICLPTHSCANIPYALNDGTYTVFLH